MAEVRLRRMTPDEEQIFTAALDALVLLVAGRVVETHRRGGNAGPHDGAGGGRVSV